MSDSGRGRCCLPEHMELLTDNWSQHGVGCSINIVILSTWLIFISSDAIPKLLTVVLLMPAQKPSLSIFQWGFLTHLCQKMPFKKGERSDSTAQKAGRPWQPFLEKTTKIRT